MFVLRNQGVFSKSIGIPNEDQEFQEGIVVVDSNIREKQTQVKVFEPSSFFVQIEDIDVEGIEFRKVVTSDLSIRSSR
jgi:hypothetical protein